ncbi:hypothetical protein SESBI_19334 [Sesbania bispinosa]|nr:hypothetical protein SESBI_19334 [Sesbania bispinosa]
MGGRAYNCYLFIFIYGLLILQFTCCSGLGIASKSNGVSETTAPRRPLLLHGFSYRVMNRMMMVVPDRVDIIPPPPGPIPNIPIPPRP